MNTEDQLRYLTRADVEGLGIDAANIVAALKQGCLAREQGRILNAPKTAVRPDADRLFMSTLAIDEDTSFMAVKSLGMNAANAHKGQPIIGSLITLFDGATPMPVAVMDADWITAVRTAGLSALAATYLANPSSATVGFVGCGTQAQAHLDIFAHLFPLTTVRALGRGAKNRDALAAQAVALGLDTVACDSAEDALAGADIVISTVPGATDLTPFVDAVGITSGAFVSLVDLGRPWIKESYGAFNRIVIEDLEQERTMPEPMVDLDLAEGDLQDLVAGRIPARGADTDTIAFIFRGLALADLALAVLAYERAVATDTGMMLPR